MKDSHFIEENYSVTRGTKTDTTPFIQEFTKTLQDKKKVLR